MRQGKHVDMEDPIYLLDKNRGTLRIPTLSGDAPYLELRNLMFKSRSAYDGNAFEVRLGDTVVRLHKDELLEAIKWI